MKVKVSEIKKWLKLLPENKWRKTYGIDARRIAYFAKYGLTTSLPEYLQRNTKGYQYLREKELAKKFTTYLEESKEKLEECIRQIIKEEIQKLDEKKIPSKNTIDWHQHAICVDIVKNPSKAYFMGNISIKEAKETLKKKFKYSDDEIAELEK